MKYLRIYQNAGSRKQGVIESLPTPPVMFAWCIQGFFGCFFFYYTATRDSSERFLSSSSSRGPATNKPCKNNKTTIISVNKARYILRMICNFANSWSLMVTYLLKHSWVVKFRMYRLVLLDFFLSSKWRFALIPSALSLYPDPNGHGLLPMRGPSGRHTGKNRRT